MNSTQMTIVLIFVVTILLSEVYCAVINLGAVIAKAFTDLWKKIAVNAHFSFTFISIETLG